MKTILKAQTQLELLSTNAVLERTSLIKRFNNPRDSACLMSRGSLSLFQRVEPL